MSTDSPLPGWYPNGRSRLAGGVAIGVLIDHAVIAANKPNASIVNQLSIESPPGTAPTCMAMVVLNLPVQPYSLSSLTPCSFEQ